MSKSETGVRSKLILELLVITYFFIAVLATKYIFKRAVVRWMRWNDYINEM